MKKILQYFRPYLWTLLLVLVMKLAAAMLDLMIPSALADILDVAVPSGELRLIILYGLQMVGFALLEAACNIPANIISSRCVIRTTQKLRQDLFEKISHLSAKQLDEVTVSSAVSRLTSDTYNINNMFLRLLRMGLRAPILMIGGLVITALEDPVLALVLVAVMPLVCFVMVFFSMRAVPVHKKKQTILDRMIMVVQENATGIRVIKALSKTEHEKKRYEKVNNELADTGLKAGLITTKSGPLINFLFHLGLIAVVLVGALRVNGGMMLSGKIVAFISYFTIIINATIGISSIFVTLSNGMASADRVVQVLEKPETMSTEEHPTEESDYSVEFRNVTFSYNGVEPNLKDISFGLKKGQTLGIIGATGSGKTTLINLLLRFYDVDEGQILLNGEDIRSIANDELRKKFGVAFQNDFLVADTIANNIKFYRDLSPEELNRAAVLAQAQEFISGKEGGMEYPLEVKANNLSGGQKQRLLIARALAANPEILVLDDSSSALDYATDASLRRALAENFQDTTKVIIAQRVSSIQSADLILVLENGEIIGKGRHEELLSSCEEYQHIAETQMEVSSRKEAAVNG